MEEQIMSTQGTIKEIMFYSNALNEEIQLLVYLPPNYSDLYKYQLLIAQDGKDYFQLGRIGRTADELQLNNDIEGTIIVGIPYADVADRRSKYHPDGEKSQSYIRFLAHELVPFLDSEFPTYQMGLGRGLIGDSLGATVSLRAALKYPHTFGKVMLQSPYVNEEVLSEVNAFQTFHLLEIFHIIGSEETAVKTSSNTIEDFLEPNRNLATLLHESNADYHYEEYEGNHTWKYWQPYLRTILLHMYSS